MTATSETTSITTAASAALELGLPQALSLAIRLHRAGNLDDARTLYERILLQAPSHADALHFSGVLAHQQGRGDAAARIRRSIALKPEVPDWHNNLGNVLLSAGQVDAAADAYEEAARLAPARADIQNNLGVLRREQKRFDEAEAAYRRAIAIDPEFVDAHTNLGNLLHGLNRGEAALVSYCEALALKPENVRARQALGMAYYTLGRFDDAAKVYADWLADEPDSPEARHHLAACSGQDVPARAADDYVEKVFDGFADSFDAKLANLHYRAPELIAQMAAGQLGAPAKALRVLDAGCGTGLCGPLLAPWARTLDGVDLSERMLARARVRGVYDTLAKAELTAHIEAMPAACCDLVVSADTLCYFGDLAPVARACAAALAPGGWLMFSVEALDGVGGQGYHLQPHGRYAHRAAYLRHVLAAAKLVVDTLERVHLRTEGGKPVEGYLVAARRPDADGDMRAGPSSP